MPRRQEPTLVQYAQNASKMSQVALQEEIARLEQLQPTLFQLKTEKRLKLDILYAELENRASREQVDRTKRSL